MSEMNGFNEAPRVPTESSVDEVQELIGRAEQVLDTLEDLGDGNCDRLRLKLSENVNLTRGKLMENIGQPRNGSGVWKRRARTLTVGAVGIAALSGFAVGLLVGRLRGSDHRDGVNLKY